MSEEQQYQGDRWTTQTKNILHKLGWTQKGDANFDIPCVNKTTHKTRDRDRKNPHGIDLVFSFYDPYKLKDVGVIVESKHRHWSGINKSEIEKFIDQLQMSIECAGTSEIFRNIGCPPVKTGLLMIWCNETDKFDDKQYREYLKQLRFTRKRNPITLYIASNTEILKWCSLIQKVNEIKTNSIEFDYFYPSDIFSGGDSSASRRAHVNLVHLFSSYIFAKSKQKLEFGDVTLTQDVNHVFFFSKPTLEELNFMYSCIKKCQLEDAKELRIHLYNTDTNYRVYIEQFKRTIEASYEQQGIKKTLNIDYMIKLSEVPEQYSKL
ncbi:hypothetical protein P4H94_19010 [Paenibacillus macerans]|uniref:hypothetical protein n=1 Tax=Paenibacillus macerans TaxID=44252 RepID=UPI001F11039B|nr:hypothetical protein [Paenibacillus macerans]MBS5915024.1 hypothetical protein [Paenibacillus macerans]MEC0138938.1 hypothetical protein [Paenibacillus macerans]UMV45295.1 hypothetical protein LMZ02_17345 [Paenibacillus macerans]